MGNYHISDFNWLFVIVFRLVLHCPRVNTGITGNPCLKSNLRHIPKEEYLFKSILKDLQTYLACAEPLMSLTVVGTRVVRGPDWQFSDQDGGEGHLGTVVTIGKGFMNPHSNILLVCWDMGNIAEYRAGFNGKYDLLVYDNAATGIKHYGVTCHECGENDIVGMRWKCSSCYDYDLCNKCYMTSKHDLEHAFNRITIPESAGTPMPPRAAFRKTQAKGLFPGAKVCRGKDWQWKQQDGGKGNIGEVLMEAPWTNVQRSAVKVEWHSHGASVYRVGHNGKVDVKCLQAGEGCAYYKDHLPKFGESDAIAIGDRVVVKLDKDVLKAPEENHGGWKPEMETSTSCEDAKRIQAQFAAKVAMVGSDLSQNDLPQPHRVSPVQQPAPQQPQTQQQPPQQQPLPMSEPIPQQSAMQPPQPGQQDATDSTEVVQPTVEASANNPAVQQATPEPTVPQPEIQDAAAAVPRESKDSKKKSQINRFQELDKKTAKGSEEFNAFETDDVQAIVQPLNLKSVDFILKKPKVQAPEPQHPVPSQSPRIPSPSVSPVAVNTLTHDMSKQGAPSRPAMAASPQQGILPNQPNPGAPPMMNMSQVRFQTPRQTLPRGYQQQMPQQVYPIRHQNQAQMQSIQHPQAGGPATQQGANPAQIMQSNAAAAAASGQYMQQGGAQYIMTGAMPIVNPMAHRPFHQQSYQQVYQPTTPPYYSSPPQPVWLNTGQTAPRQQFNSQQPAVRSDSQQRSKKFSIRIVDPTTNQDVTETLLRDTSGSSSPHSGRSSANVTPPVSTSSEDAKRIQAQFASKVAMVASDLPQTDLPQPHRVPPVQQPAPQPQTQQQPPQQPPPVPQPMPQPIPQQSAMQPPQPGQQVIVMPVVPGGQSVPAVPAGGNFTGIAPGAAAPAVAQLSSQPVEPAVPEGTQNTVVAATPVAEAVQPPRPVPQAAAAAAAVPAAVPGQDPVPMQQSGVQGPPAQQVPTEAMPPAVQTPQNPAPVPVAAAVPPAGPPANVQAAAAAPVQEVVPVKHEHASANTASTAGKASPPEQQDATDGAAVPAVVQPTVEPNAKRVEDGSKQTISSANNPAVQQATPAPAVPQPEIQDAAAAPQESKDSKKKSQKKRLQELDKKTATGSDEFDAYKTDDVQVSTSSQENPGKEANVVLEPEAKVSNEPAKEIVQDVSPSEKPKETTQPQEDKRSTEKTDDAPQSDVAKRKNEKELVVSEKQAEVAVMPDTTPAKVDAEEKRDRYDATEDRENVNEADNVESENSKNKEGKPNPKDNKMQLKYTYREDQWSPANPEGKKQYGRDFLLQFQKECTDKPDGLPNIPDIVLDKAVVQTSINQGGNQKNSDFMPHFMKSPRVQGKQPNFPTGQGRRSSREPLKVIQRARDSAETKLATSDKAWKPGYKRGPEESKDEEAVKTAELYRNFTSILNKLTPQLFTKLTDKALKLPIDTEERLTGVINLVFEKAISEPNFSTAYAHMCQKLSQLKVQSSTNPGQQVQFRPILVHNCQQEFEKEKQSEIDEAQRRKEIAQLPANQQEAQLELLDEKLFKAKRRTMGNIRFIGELYKLRILTENIMHNCVMKLLKAKEDDALECLCNLMSTIGKDLDHEKAKNRMDQYFSKIDKIVASQKNQPRIRFLLCDLIDLRKSNWVPRRKESKPTTIDALHREWHVAEAKKAEESKNYNGPSRSREQAPPPRTVTPQADDGWNTVPTTNKTRTAYDPAKLKLTRMTTADDNIQLGPGGRGFNMWGRGSIGASNKNQSTSDSASSSQDDPAPSQANRFSMLSEDAKRPVSRGGSGGYGSRDSRGRGQSPISKRSSRERDREREKEAAIAEVQRISRGRPSRPEQPEPRGSKEIAPRPEKKEEPTMTDAKVKQTSKATIDEFLNLRDFAEATRCVSELPSKQRHLFVQATVDHVIEKKQDMREAVGVFFHSLMNSNLLTKEQYLTGMKDTIEFADDMAIDIPKIYEYLGELMGAMLVGGADYLQLHATAIKPLLEQEKAGVLLAEILRTASRRLGASKVSHIWQQASLKWEGFLPAGENVQEFVQKKGVDFTLDGASAADNGLNSVSSQGDWLHVFNRGLTNLLNERPDNNKIFDWIEHNVADTQKQHSEFIRALVTIICQNAAEGEGQSCRIDPEILKQRGPVLQRYIDNKRPLELQALYAVQALNHSLHSPPGLLRILFDVLYDEDVVTEESFYDWKGSEDPKESAGKGVALKSVTSFFTWLAEAD